MILPITAYGHPVLRKKATPISRDYPKLKTLIEDMFETMENASGVGIAAPQIGLSIRLFVVDISPFVESGRLSEEELKFFDQPKKVFINPTLLKEEGEFWSYNEGCLSIPNIHEDIFRAPNISIEYLDENFEKHTANFSGLIARVIQHEYDHIEGVLFTDKVSPLRRQVIKGKLQKIAKGEADTEYEMSFYKK